MEKIKKNKTLIILVLIIIIIAVFTTINNPKKISEEKINEQPQVVRKLSNDEIKTEIDNILGVLMQIHYVSVIEKTTDNPNTIILDELQESMNDLNKLQGILYNTEKITKLPNELLATTGQVLHVSTQLLIKSYTSYIGYLRTVDMNNVEIAEFQYQTSLFQTSTHDTYINLVKGASLLPMITVEFAKEEGGANSVNEDLKNHFLSKIDELFSDILIDNDKFYKNTKNRYAIAILIQGYKDFFKN